MSGGSKDKPEANLFTSEFIGAAWEWLYVGGATLTGDPGFKISEDEADELTKATLKLLGTVDKKKLERLEKKYGKYVPGLELVAAVGIITVPRVKHAIQLRRARRHASPVPPPQNGRAPAPAAPVASGSNAPPPTHRGASSEHESGQGGPGFVTRPIRNEDGAALGFFNDA